MFNYQNGDYNIELIIGDAVLSNSFQWVLGTVSLKFPEGAVSEDVKKPSYKQPNVYTLQPEIKVIIYSLKITYPMLVSDKSFKYFYHLQNIGKTKVLVIF